MQNPDPHLIEFAVGIVWDYLEKTGEVEEPCGCSRFLRDCVEVMACKGNTSRLLLSNLAIIAYRKFKDSKVIHLSPETAHR